MVKVPLMVMVTQSRVTWEKYQWGDGWCGSGSLEGHLRGTVWRMQEDPAWKWLHEKHKAGRAAAGHTLTRCSFLLTLDVQRWCDCFSRHCDLHCALKQTLSPLCCLFSRRFITKSETKLGRPFLCFPSTRMLGSTTRPNHDGWASDTLRKKIKISLCKLFLSRIWEHWHKNLMNTKKNQTKSYGA